MSYQLNYTKVASKDIAKLKAAKLDAKAKLLFDLVKENPFTYPPEFEQLQGKYHPTYSRRINRTHRLVYEIYEAEGIVKVLSLWSHYER